MVVIRRTFYFWPQYSGPRLVPDEMHHEICAGIPDVVRDRIEGGKRTEEVLDIHVRGRGPPCFSKSGRVRFEMDWIAGLNHGL